MNIYFRHVFLLFSMLLISFNLVAHEQSIAKLELNQIGTSVRLNWQVGLKDIARLAQFDNDGDGNIQWKEVLQNPSELSRVLKDNLTIYTQVNQCHLAIQSIDLARLSNGNALEINSWAECQSPVTKVHYAFLQGLDQLHVAHIRADINGLEQRYLFRDSDRNFLLDDKSNLSEQSNQQSSFVQFVYQGILHIWIGIDHLAFLVILLLSARTSRHSFKHSLRRLLVFASTFTLAHTLTLISASLNWIQLPSWFVETIIAASVAWGAFCLIKGGRSIDTPTVFGFGLIHGLGFASVLADLTGDLSANVLLLLGFNLGVEIGQLVFLLVLLLLLSWPIKSLGITSVARWLSAPIMLVATIWMVERIADVKFLPI